MLDMGFEKDVRTIIGFTPSTRRTVMFTATWPQSIRALAEEFLSDPVRVTVGSQELTANHRVTQVPPPRPTRLRPASAPPCPARGGRRRDDRTLVGLMPPAATADNTAWFLLADRRPPPPRAPPAAAAALCPR